MVYLTSVQAWLASLRELQSAMGEELSALLQSVLDKAFKGELREVLLKGVTGVLIFAGRG